MSDKLELKAYVRIDFKHCRTDYDWTICPFCDIQTQLQIAESSLVDYEPAEDEEYGKPEITITPILMTEEDYQKQVDEWFLT